MADYDSGEITDRERTAAKRQKELSGYNDNTLKGVAKYNENTARNLAQWNSDLQNSIAWRSMGQTRDIAESNARATQDQLKAQLANYDMANKQNASLRDTQFKQASRKSEAERFEAQRNLQNAALGLFGSMNQAMNGSSTGNTMHMLRNRNDAENSTYWQTLQDNRNAIQNAYDESFNQNQVAKRDAAINAIKALRDIDSDFSASLANIQNDLYSNLGNIRGDLIATLGNISGDLLSGRRNLHGDLAANLNNINPNLYEKPADINIPEGGYKIPASLNEDLRSAIWSASNIWDDPIYAAPGGKDWRTDITRAIEDAVAKRDSVTANKSRLLDYVMPANAEQQVHGYRTRRQGGDYFSRLMNGFNV